MNWPNSAGIVPVAKSQHRNRQHSAAWVQSVIFHEKKRPELQQQQPSRRVVVVGVRTCETLAAAGHARRRLRVQARVAAVIGKLTCCAGAVLGRLARGCTALARGALVRAGAGLGRLAREARAAKLARGARGFCVEVRAVVTRLARRAGGDVAVAVAAVVAAGARAAARNVNVAA